MRTKPKEDVVITTVRIPKSLMWAAREAAVLDRRAFSDLLRSALEEKVQKLRKTKKGRAA